MNGRLERVFDEIPACDTFADVACDHGYVALAMLASGKCRRAFVSDISEKSLKKAQTLLAEYIASGKCESFVSDGFDNLPYADCALIAGVGGDLITEIIERAERLPETLVLQPMKNCEKVRRAAVRLGYAVKKDFTIKYDGQFYDIISLAKGKDYLTDEEAEFGRTNVKTLPPDFREKTTVETGKLLSYIQSAYMDDETRKKMLDRVDKLKQYV